MNDARMNAMPQASDSGQSTNLMDPQTKLLGNKTDVSNSVKEIIKLSLKTIG